MTKPKDIYRFIDAVFSDQRLEISSNYRTWDDISDKPEPVYIEIYNGDGEFDPSTCVGISTEQAKGIVAALTEIINYLEAEND